MSDPTIITFNSNLRTPTADEEARLGHLLQLSLHRQTNGDGVVVLPEVFPATNLDGPSYAVQLRLIEKGATSGNINILLGIEPSFESGNTETASGWLKSYALPANKLKTVSFGPINEDEIPDLGLILGNDQKLIILGEKVENPLLHKILELEQINTELKTRLNAFNLIHNPFSEKADIHTPDLGSLELLLHLAKYYVDTHQWLKTTLTTQPTMDQRNHYLAMLEVSSTSFFENMIIFLEYYYFFTLSDYCWKFSVFAPEIRRYLKGKEINLSTQKKYQFEEMIQVIAIIVKLGYELTDFLRQKKIFSAYSPTQATLVQPINRMIFQIEETVPKLAIALAGNLKDILAGKIFDPNATRKLQPF